jgi:hypothetical protein
MEGKSTLERAFELARQGRLRTLEEIRRQLSCEKFEMVDRHLAGLGIRKQIRALIKASATDREAERRGLPERKRSHPPNANRAKRRRHHHHP